MLPASRIYRKLPGWLTRAVDAYQIWNSQLDGWLSRLVGLAVSAGGLLWTWLGESWLPMAVVVGVSLYLLTRRLMPFAGQLSQEDTAASAIRDDTSSRDQLPPPVSGGSSVAPSAEQAPDRQADTPPDPREQAAKDEFAEFLREFADPAFAATWRLRDLWQGLTPDTLAIHARGAWPLDETRSIVLLDRVRQVGSHNTASLARRQNEPLAHAPSRICDDPEFFHRTLGEILSWFVQQATFYNNACDEIEIAITFRDVAAPYSAGGPSLMNQWGEARKIDYWNSRLFMEAYRSWCLAHERMRIACLALAQKQPYGILRTARRNGPLFTERPRSPMPYKEADAPGKA